MGVTKTDYDTVLIPGIEKYSSGNDKVRIYYHPLRISTALIRVPCGEDTKVGVSHFMRWNASPSSPMSTGSNMP